MRHEEKLMQAEKALTELKAKVTTAQYRQKYHFMPPAGWMNDPNGCIYFQGKYHLFYQHNPYAAVWGAMHWGHATSEDLIHWEHHPIALAPSESYDDHSEGGVFSGSTVEHNGEMIAFYTATTNYGDGFVQAQCMAKSSDGGIHFQKYADNPIIEEQPAGISSDFRDPRVFRHKDKWYMILGASIGEGAWHGGEGCALMYRSDNLTNWEYCGIIARSNGQYGTMWECPDLFFLDDKWVLTFCPMFNGKRKSIYFVGDMNFEQAKFTVEQEGDIDFGGEYYASQSMKDDRGRTIMMAWQNGWDWMEGWKDFGPTAEEGWCGCTALPRTVELDQENRLIFKPVEEMKALRTGERSLENVQIEAKKIEISVEDPICFEMELSIDCTKSTAEKLFLDLRANDAYKSRITLDFQTKKLSFDRNNSDDHSEGAYECDVELSGDEWTIRIFSDVSSIELFCDAGRRTMSNTIYPRHQNQGIYLSAEQGSVFLKKALSWGIQKS